MRRTVRALVWALALFLVPAAAFAQDGGASAGNTTAGIARNPGAAGAMFVNFILGMVLIESIAIYGLVIAIMLQGKI